MSVVADAWITLLQLGACMVIPPLVVAGVRRIKGKAKEVGEKFPRYGYKAHVATEREKNIEAGKKIAEKIIWEIRDKQVKEQQEAIEQHRQAAIKWEQAAKERQRIWEAAQTIKLREGLLCPVCKSEYQSITGCTNEWHYGKREYRESREAVPNETSVSNSMVEDRGTDNQGNS